MRPSWLQNGDPGAERGEQEGGACRRGEDRHQDGEPNRDTWLLPDANEQQVARREQHRVPEEVHGEAGIAREPGADGERAKRRRECEARARSTAGSMGRSRARTDQTVHATNPTAIEAMRTLL